MKPEHKLLFVISAVGLVACGAAPTDHPRPVPASSASATPVAASFSDTKWARFRSKRFELSMAFPEGKTWRIDDHSSPWLTARHPATGTVVFARVWHEANIVNAAACENRAREWMKDLPDLRDTDVVDKRHLAGIPANGYDTQLRAGIIAPPNASANAPISGVVLAFGASMKKCFAAVFRSDASGAGSSAQTGDKLAFGTRILESAVHQSELELPGRQAPSGLDQR